MNPRSREEKPPENARHSASSGASSNQQVPAGERSFRLVERRELAARLDRNHTHDAMLLSVTSEHSVVENSGPNRIAPNPILTLRPLQTR